MQDLAEQDRSGDMKGWLQRVHTWLFDRDLFAGVVADDNLMRIHATAEEYEPAAEEQCVPFQASHTALHCCADGDCLMSASIARHALGTFVCAGACLVHLCSFTSMPNSPPTKTHQLTQFRSTLLPAARQHPAAHARNLVQYKQQTAVHATNSVKDML